MPTSPTRSSVAQTRPGWGRLPVMCVTQGGVLCCYVRRLLTARLLFKTAEQTLVLLPMNFIFFLRNPS